MSNNEMYIEINSGAKATFVDPKTKRTMYQVTDRNKHYELLHKKENVEEYCSIKKIDKGLIYCDLAVSLIEESIPELNMPKSMKDEFTKIRIHIQEQLENNPIKGSKHKDFVIKDQFYQCVTLYEKEKNPFMDS